MISKKENSRYIRSIDFLNFVQHNNWYIRVKKVEYYSSNFCFYKYILIHGIFLGKCKLKSLFHIILFDIICKFVYATITRKNHLDCNCNFQILKRCCTILWWKVRSNVPSSQWNAYGNFCERLFLRRGEGVVGKECPRKKTLVVVLVVKVVWKQ